jgi:hypothetical protein
VFVADAQRHATRGFERRARGLESFVHSEGVVPVAPDLPDTTGDSRQRHHARGLLIVLVMHGVRLGMFMHHRAAFV